jgi:hypothetical protein
MIKRTSSTPSQHTHTRAYARCNVGDKQRTQHKTNHAAQISAHVSHRRGGCSMCGSKPNGLVVWSDVIAGRRATSSSELSTPQKRRSTLKHPLCNAMLQRAQTLAEKVDVASSGKGRVRCHSATLIRSHPHTHTCALGKGRVRCHSPLKTQGGLRWADGPNKNKPTETIEQLPIINGPAIACASMHVCVREWVQGMWMWGR